MAGPKGSRGVMRVTPDASINYELVGHWKEANYMLRTFPHKVDQAINLANRSFVRDYVRRVKSNIQNQGASLGWAPITSQAYLDFKSKHSNADPHQLYRFFDILSRSIVSYKTPNGWVAGIPENLRNPSMDDIRGGKTLSVSEYAAVLEFGAPQRNIEARPLWYPSFLQIGGRTNLVERVKKEIRAKFPSVKLKFPKGSKK